MDYFIFMALFSAICLGVVLGINTMEYMDSRKRIKKGKPRTERGLIIWNQNKESLVKSRRYMRLSFVGLLLTPLAGILVPVAAVLAGIYGVWKLIYMLFFEKVEVDE